MSGYKIEWERVGQEVKHRMAQMRVSTRDLSRILELSHSTIGRMSNGKPSTVESYLTIVKWLNVDPFYFAVWKV